MPLSIYAGGNGNNSGAVNRENATISADTNNLSIGAGTSWLVLNSDTADVVLTGIAGGVANRKLYISLIQSGTWGAVGNVFLSQEDSNSTAANRFNLGRSVSCVGLTSGDAAELVYDGTLSRWVVLGVYRGPSLSALTYCDAAYQHTTISLSGAGSGNAPIAGPNFIKGLHLKPGSDTNGRAGVISTDTSLTFPGKYCLSTQLVTDPTAISDATNTFVIRIGFLNSVTGEPTNGCYFRYQYNIFSGNWQAVCRDDGTETKANTGVPYAPDDVLDMGIFLNGTGAARFYLRGYSSNSTMSMVAKITSNIPQGSGRAFGVGVSVINTAGTTDFDWDTRPFRIDTFGDVG